MAKGSKKPKEITNAGDSISAENAFWSFGGNVPLHFDEHVKKSVPLYDLGHSLIVKLSDFFLFNGSNCYELGCSTGKLTWLLAQRHLQKNVHFFSVDIEKNMIAEAEKRCSELSNINFIVSDLLAIDFEKSDLIVSYYTIQFIHPKNRQILIDRIYQALNWGGSFILFEKVRGPDARFQDIMTSIYSDYKLDQGYTPEEIVAKARSIKGVLEPFSTNGNMDLLKRAGFVDVMPVMKYACFEGTFAIK